MLDFIDILLDISPSDNWCEQMGYVGSIGAANTWVELFLYIPYATTRYIVTAVNAGSSATIYTGKVGSSSKNETDKFYISSSNANTAFWWKTEGYI